MSNFPVHQKTKATIDKIITAPSQAYLFYGQKGLGKLRVAYDVAYKILKIDASKLTNGAAHAGLVFIGPEEGKKNIAISQVRDLSNKIWRTGSSTDSKRVIIINGIDKTLAPAANALLKNLEDCPRGATFILIAESSEKVIPTIRSRVQLVYFREPNSSLVEEYLVDKYNIKSGLAAELVMMAHGVPSRAEGLMDEVLLDETKQLNSLVKDFIKSNIPHRFVIAKIINEQKMGKDFLQELTYAIRQQSTILMQGDKEVDISLKNLDKVMHASTCVNNNINTRLILEDLALSLK